MSTSVDTAFIKQYEREVKHVFQRQGGILRNTVRLKTGVVGSSTTFQKIGSGMATTKARHGQITPMNQDHTAIECTLSDRYAGDYVDKLDEAKTNIDERDAIAMGGAWACGRAIDDDLFTAMDATTQTAVTLTYTSSATVRNSLLNIAKALNANDVPNDGMRYCALTANAWACAETVEQFSSSDFVDANGRPFVDGTPYPGFRRWMGILWTNHQGLPGAGASSGAKGFAWHKNAVGYAMGSDITVDIDWQGDRAAHFVNHMFSGGAKIIDDKGVIEITIGDDTTALPTS
jgi:hypothetical protein